MSQSAESRPSWFLRLAFGSGPGPERSALSTLGLVSLAMAFENYDVGMVNAALPEISQSLAIAPEDSGYYLALIRLGGLGTLLLVPFADRFGRRRIFLLSLIGMSVGMLATALTQTALQFAFVQSITRIFLLTGSALALVILVEEFPAEHRGSGIGVMSLLGGLGAGVSAFLYAAVDFLPYGWRALYFIGLVPLILIPFFRRSLQETRRFEAQEAQGTRDPTSSLFQTWVEPVALFVRTHPGRATAIGSAGLLAALASISFFQYTNLFLREHHGWTPAQFSMLFVTGGAIAALGPLVGGRGSDRFGRKRVGFLALCLIPLTVAAFFYGPEWALFATWGLALLTIAAGDLVIRAFATEVFPTSQRGTAGGWLIGVQTIGWTLGLLLVGILADDVGDIRGVVTALSTASFAAAGCLLVLPETSARELESLDETSEG